MRRWLARLAEAQRRQLRRAGARYSGRVFGVPVLAISARRAVLALVAVLAGGERATPFVLLLLFNATVLGWTGYVIYGYDRDRDGAGEG